MAAGALILSGAPGGRVGGAVLMVVFGFGAAMSVLQLVSRSRLELSPAGFTVVALGRQSTMSWSEVCSFQVVTADPTALNNLVAVNLVREEHLGGVSGAVKAACSYNRLLLDTYGMKAEKLAAVMNEWRSKYSTAGPGRLRA